MFDPSYAASLAARLAEKPRFTGTPGERRGAEIISGELKAAGYDVRREGFRVETYRVVEARLESLSPSFKVPCSPVGFSGETGEEGVEGDLVYIEGADPALLPSQSGWVGLSSVRPGKEEWRELVGKASGLVIAESNACRLPSHVSIPYEWREKYGSLPAVYVSYSDAYRLLGSKRVRLVLRQEYRRSLAFNIVAEKRGYKYPEEVILVTAHYDSVRGVRGAIDNAGGAAFAVALARALAQGEFKRTLRVTLFSGEELGLRGSQAYVKKHRDELGKIKLVVNLDVHGDAIGRNASVVTGPKELRNYVESKAKIAGLNLQVSENVMSSDGTSFAQEDIPALNFYRSCGTGVYMHTIRDNGRFISEQGYALIGPFVEALLRELLDAEKLPFKREVPSDLKKKVDEYFSRWRV